MGTKETDDHVDSEAGRGTEMETELGRKSEAGLGRAFKRDSQGLPKAVVPDEAGHADLRLDGEEEEEEEEGGRFLSVIEETSFDLDKVSVPASLEPFHPVRCLVHNTDFDM